ncbi:MAG: Carboxy-terminal domain (CTD) phosphatase [Bogoriella megaspora]|nr:MAG: Carboxy-terminal domain (CTD) phosphatase [Bogoriella megaspora]
MLIRSPPWFHYPIKITKLLVDQNGQVERNQKLFAYEYPLNVTKLDDFGDEHAAVDIRETDFESEIPGKVVNWLVSVGESIPSAEIAMVEIEEPCRHEIQFGGLCAQCGQDMSEISYNQTRPDTERATVNMFHGNTALLVSPAEASRSEEDAKRRLLSQKKLSLVVDLDQTIIHATVDPTVAEWQRDNTNPNYDAVKDVRAFQLADDGPGQRQACWYYIKMRPGLDTFFEEIGKMFECHIYTMGTRAYALNIAKIVDPDRKIFGDRILSRDESGSLVAKNLQRLFPVDTKMVVIMDDRADVWKWSENLIRLPAYDFFIGIGDINASFLPKRQDAGPPSPRPERLLDLPGEQSNDENGRAPSRVNGTDINGDSDATSNGDLPTEANGAESTVDQLVSMNSADSAEALKEKTSQQDETIAAQLADRPLLQKQKILDAEEEKASQAAATKEANGDASSQDIPFDEHKYRHNLLQDDDEELLHLEKVLRKVHDHFFAEYEKRKLGGQGGRIAQLQGSRTRSNPNDELSLVPDIKEIMPAMKQQALSGVSLVFSGIIPLGVDVQSADKSEWAKSFGADIKEDLTKRTTHVIATPARKTAKVRRALRYPNRIKVVTEHWLFECIRQWRRVEERPYLIDFGVDQHDPKNVSEVPFGTEDVLLSSDDDEESGQATDVDEESDSNINGNNGKNGNVLTINTGAPEDEEDLTKYAPDEQDLTSPHPKNSNWEEMDDELREFMGSDYEDSEANDGESEVTEDDDEEPSGTVSGQVEPSSKINGETLKDRPQKRKRGDSRAPSERSNDAEDSDASMDTASGGSKLQKRKRKAIARTTSLTNVKGIVTGESMEVNEVVSIGEGEQEVDGGEDDDSDAGALEAELEAELSKELEEDDDDE